MAASYWNDRVQQCAVHSVAQDRTNCYPRRNRCTRALTKSLRRARDLFEDLRLGHIEHLASEPARVLARGVGVARAESGGWPKRDRAAGALLTIGRRELFFRRIHEL